MLLFEPQTLGKLELANRVVMAPMTRSRAVDEQPNDMHAAYYEQRASAGLIITEGVQPSAEGQGYCRTPGIHSAEQVKAWSKVTAAVHNRGGNIALQVMHCGRVGHPDNKTSGAETVAPSALRAEAEIFTGQGMAPMMQPRALRLDEIPRVIADYRRATELAFDAGFDAVELHGTSGYLPAQFMATGTNLRNDCYGGDVANRCRFVIELLQAMASVNDAGNIGLRICPGNPFNDLVDEQPQQSFEYLLNRISSMGLAYLHMIHSPSALVDEQKLRQCFAGAVILNGGSVKFSNSYSKDTAEAALQSGAAQCISFGRDFIANPDLVERMRNDWPLAEFDVSGLYSAGPQGYCDYPNHR